MNRTKYIIIFTIFFTITATRINNVHGIESQNLVVIKYTSSPPEIDGIVNDIVWNAAQKTHLPWTFNGEISSEGFLTQVMVLYDENALYIAFLNHEPRTDYLLSKALGHDGSVFRDDCVGFLIDVGNADNGSYFNVYVNAINTRYEGWIPSNHLQSMRKNGEIPQELLPIAMAYTNPRDWNPENIQTASFIDKNFWSIEMKIPFKDLLTTKPLPGDIWGANFVRNIPKWKANWQTWTNAGKKFSNTETFGQIQFAE